MHENCGVLYCEGHSELYITEPEKFDFMNYYFFQ